MNKFYSPSQQKRVSLLLLGVTIGLFVLATHVSWTYPSFFDQDDAFLRDQLLKDSSSSAGMRSNSKDATKTTNKIIPRFLYIITSGGQGRKDDALDARFRDKLQPTIVNSVESLIRNNFCTVDVYLVLSFALDPPQEAALRQALPEGVGLEIWTDAIPMGISCKHNDENSCMNQREGQRKRYGPRAKARLQRGGAQLARQHRFVVKDKLPYYDFFLAFEDDMLIKQSHVRQHMKWMRYLRKLQAKAPKRQGWLGIDKKQTDWKVPLTRQQLMRFRPGFIRVEALQPGHREVEDTLSFPFNESNVQIDPRHCCSPDFDGDLMTATTTNANKSAPSIQPDELMVWETTILGQGVRSLEPLLSNKQSTADLTWVTLLATEPFRMAPASLWPGDLMTPKPPNLQRHYASAKNLAQSAGWMGSPREIMEYHNDLCAGGFLPPYDPEEFPKDAWANNVEFWSGGIQLWAEKCSIQRFLPLQEFDRHLLYHTSDNKQLKMPKERQILIRDMLGELLVVRQHAEKTLLEASQ